MSKTAPRTGPARSGRPPLKLDPADPADQKILNRQQAVARQAGREGRDRAASTRGRADLEQAYDEGTADPAPADPAPTAPAARGRAKTPAQAPAKGTAPAAGNAKPGLGQRAAAGLSKGSWAPTSPTSPPSRVADAGGLLTGALLYTVVITYIRYGPSGWTGWLKAKFLNNPMSTSAASSASGSTSEKGIPT